MIIHCWGDHLRSNNLRCWEGRKESWMCVFSPLFHMSCSLHSSLTQKPDRTSNQRPLLTVNDQKTFPPGLSIRHRNFPVTFNRTTSCTPVRRVCHNLLDNANNKHKKCGEGLTGPLVSAHNHSPQTLTLTAGITPNVSVLSLDYCQK